MTEKKKTVDAPMPLLGTNRAAAADAAVNAVRQQAWAEGKRLKDGTLLVLAFAQGENGAELLLPLLGPLEVFVYEATASGIAPLMRLIRQEQPSLGPDGYDATHWQMHVPRGSAVVADTVVAPAAPEDVQ